MTDASNLRMSIRICLGDTDHDWEITSAPSVEYEQGVTIIRYAAGIDEEIITQIHKIIETAVEGLLCE